MSSNPQPPGETLQLNPNCCYKACAGCTSLAGLRDFQGRFPADWPQRLAGSPRLIEAVLQQARPAGIATGLVAGTGSVQPAGAAGHKACEECGAFAALDFGHVWLCADCHAIKAACGCSDLGRKKRRK